MTAEKWRPIKGHSYEVSNKGRIRSRHKIRALNVNQKSGHLQVTLHKNGTRKTFYVHTLVLEAFISLRPDGLQACHNDGNPLNNDVNNLRWDTAASNYNDRRKHGVDCSGERYGKAKLTWKEIQIIRKRVCSGETQQSVADSFGIGQPV